MENIQAETTEDLATIRKHPHRFMWGIVVKIHDIGPYSIVEYKNRIRGVRKGLDTTPGVTNFQTYVDGKTTNYSMGTLDEALLLAMGVKHCGHNEGRYMGLAAAKLFFTRGTNEG